MCVVRRYTEQRDYTLPDAATTVRAESLARKVLVETFEPLLNGIRFYISMTAPEGYKSTGDDWDTVLAELTSDGLTPQRTYAALYSADPRSTSISHAPEITSSRERCEVSVELSSEDEGVVRATTAKLDRLMAPLIAGRPEVETASPAASLPQPSAPVTPNAPALAPVASPQPDTAPPPSWMARTWRDHAAALVITVAGTVIAAALLVVLNIGG